jgi:phospholipase/carboxylesterase
MIHYFKDNKSDKTFVLLHGTGGDEHDLVPLAQDINGNYNILSLRGRINEGGMLRFFRRFDMFNFDLVNVKEEAEHITKFLASFKKEHNLKDLVLLGYSNGASMIEALLLEDDTLYKGAVLLQPGLLKEDLKFKENKSLKVFTSVSDNDPYLPVSRQQKLVNALNESYDVTVSRHNNGHGITYSVLHDLRKWLD